MLNRSLLVVAALLLGACGGQPDDAQIQSDVAGLFPGCTVQRAIAAENAGFDVWMDVTLTCASGSREESLLYRQEGGNWAVISHPQKGAS